MDIKEKVEKALMDSFEDAYVLLDDDDGISGLVVSPRFKGLTAMDRQELIGNVLDGAPAPLTARERRRVLMIAGLTPVEYDSIGPRIRVHQLREFGDGTIEIRLHGRAADAEYVRNVLEKQAGIETTNPNPVPGTNGALKAFRAKGTTADPLTKEKVQRLLERDSYIEVMPNA